MNFTNLIIFLSLAVNSLIAQKTIDPSFDKMLSKLLKHSVTEVSPEQVDPNNVIFMDAREIEEYNVSHLPRALHIGYNHFDIKKWKHLNKKDSIIVYCTVGYRSEKIAEKLQENGFKNVRNLYGGIFEWMHQQKLVKNKNNPTDSIHTFNKQWSKWLKRGIKIY